MMTNTKAFKCKFYFGFSLLLGLVLMICSCAGSQSAKKGPSAYKQIIGIEVSEDSENCYVLVRGNEPLTYTSVKQNSPLGVLFYFPDTGIDEEIDTQNVNDLVSELTATQMTEVIFGTRVWVALNHDVPYNVTSEVDGIKFTFSKPMIAPVAEEQPEAMPVEETVETPPIETPEPAPEIAAAVPLAAPAAAPAPPETPPEPATIFTSVYVTKSEDKVKVSLMADGTIDDYKTFTMTKPARIVIDLNNIKSRYTSTQTVKVNTRWLSKIRHFGHPDKVRVVLETKDSYLKTFSAVPSAKGLDVLVGDHIEAAPQAE